MTDLANRSDTTDLQERFGPSDISVMIFTREIYDRLKKEGVLNTELNRQPHSDTKNEEVLKLLSNNDMIISRYLYDYLATNGIDMYEILKCPVLGISDDYEVSGPVPFDYAKPLIEEALAPIAEFRRTDSLSSEEEIEEGKNAINIKLFKTEMGTTTVVLILNKVINNSNKVYLPHFVNLVYKTMADDLGVSTTLKSLRKRVFKYL